MAVGTIETTVETRKKWKKRSGLTTGGSGRGGKNRGGGGGGNNGGGGGGGDNPYDKHLHDIESFEPNKSKVLTWFLLVIVLMTFSVLIGSYIVLATTRALEWKPFEHLPVQIWVSTILILASSLTLYMAQKAVCLNRRDRAKIWLLGTTALGATFISSQILAWLMLVRQGIYVQSNPYAGFFYILTAVHAVHVVGGIIALGAIVLKVWSPDNSGEGFERRKTLSQVVGWYWHLMGVIWLVLLFLLGFWK
ncbi:MAG: Alternative cytochrome c oxidase polypeptide CoxO [Acidobacteria bacterium]|jgi:cytochrome c oxidase subunit 3|nr:Alternative cytochrome c oxidase polypeptide CoxO [Acidobacteriota bacterium]